MNPGSSGLSYVFTEIKDLLIQAIATLVSKMYIFIHISHNF